MSGSSFTFVQAGTAIEPYSGSPSVTFPNPVSNGNLIVALFALYDNGGHTLTVPTSVTDSLGNVYDFITTNGTFADNGQNYVAMYISQFVIPGTCTVTFNGFVGSGFVNGPHLIVAEYEVPSFYQIFILGITDLTHDAYETIDLSQSDISFRALANNGPPGGADCSDTTQVTMNLTAVGVNEEGVNNEICGVALMNQFFDVMLINGNFNSWEPTPPYWTSSTGANIRAITIDATGGSGATPGISAVLADQDFPYLNGPLIANCDNPPNGTVGVVYGPGGVGHNILADGGSGSYTFTIIAGSLPTGLSINATTGLISGTPTIAGKFLFTVQVSDGFSIVTLNCSISICPVSGANTGGNYAFYSRH